MSAGTAAAVSELAIVPQRALLLAGTIAENILVGRPLVQEQLEWALEKCALLEDLASLPQRELTEVGERGVTLSGGQQQRIALARALYGQPRLLILDDPLSAVDVKSQAKLLQTLHEFVEGDTGPANADKAGGNAALATAQSSRSTSCITCRTSLGFWDLRADRLTEKSADEFAEAKAAAPQPAMAPAPAKEEVPSSNGKHDAKEVEITIVHSEKPNAKTEKAAPRRPLRPKPLSSSPRLQRLADLAVRSSSPTISKVRPDYINILFRDDDCDELVDCAWRCITICMVV